MIRQNILLEYATWHAISALRSGSPVKDRERIKAYIRMININKIGDIVDQPAFDRWHSRTCEFIQKAEPELSYGWCAKIVNVYLKTLVYVSEDFYPSKRKFLHPPIDSMLQDALKKVSLQKTKKPLGKLSKKTYLELIDLYRTITKREHLMPVEIEKYWKY